MDENAEKKVKIFSRHENMAWRVVADLKKDVADLKSRMGWYGDARVRYFQNKKQSLTDNYAYRDGRGGVFEERVRLGFWANPDKNLSVDGRLKLENTIAQDDGWGNARENFNTWDNSFRNQGKFGIDRMTLAWNNAGTQVRIGRNEVKLGQGLLWWENPIDGVEVQHQFGDKVTAKVGYGDTAAGGWYNSNLWTVYGDVKVQTSPATSITLSALHNVTKMKYAKSVTNTWNEPVDVWDDAGNKVGTAWVPKSETKDVFTNSNYKMNQIALGFDTQLAPKWNWVVEGVVNNVGSIKDGEEVNKKGLWSRLTYGNLVWNQAKTWNVYAEYFNFGNASMDSLGWGHHMNIAGGNASCESWGNGTKGWGLGTNIQLAKCTNLELTYYFLKPHNRTDFDNYNNVGYAALTYSF